jgi:hypothetical protein
MIAAAANPLLDHIWGISAAQDRIWATITGVAPSRTPWDRPFIVLQAFLDESYTDGSSFALAGYVSTAANWAAFSQEWEELLPLARRNNKGDRRFKMSEFARSVKDAEPFYRVIEKHALLSVVFYLNISDIERAKSRIWIDGTHIEFGHWDDPYFLTFFSFLEAIQFQRVSPTNHPHSIPLIKRVMPPDKELEFYFDDNSKKNAIRAAWELFVDTRDEEAQPLYGSEPRFDKEENLLPLQAADFWAWWVRHAHETNTWEAVRRGNFAEWEREKQIPGILIGYDEEDIVANYMKMARSLIGWDAPIYDAKYHPKPILEAKGEETFWKRLWRRLSNPS